jgi:nucleoside 2-deoxyribosyltransferase
VGAKTQAAETKTGKPKCFVIMPVTTPDERIPGYSGGAEHFRHVLAYLFTPALEEEGFEVVPPIAKGADLIKADIIKKLIDADLVLCDMSIGNPNVFFELGVRTALNKPVCMLVDDLTGRAPFDLNDLNYYKYAADLHPWVLKAEVPKLREHIRSAWQEGRAENHMWKFFGLTQMVAEAPPKGSQEELLRNMLIRLEHLEGIQKADGNWTPPVALSTEVFDRFVRQASKILADHLISIEQDYGSGYPGVWISGDVELIKHRVRGLALTFNTPVAVRHEFGELVVHP